MVLQYLHLQHRPQSRFKLSHHPQLCCLEQQIPGFFCTKVSFNNKITIVAKGMRIKCNIQSNENMLYKQRHICFIYTFKGVACFKNVICLTIL